MRNRLLASLVTLPLVLLAGGSWSMELTPEESLGEAMFADVNFSYNQTQSCRSCHDPAAGFADPDHTPVSLGADGKSRGRRNGPTAAYAGLSPVRYLVKRGTEYYGGLFWDSRASGVILADPLREQAQGPPLNPAEMAMPSAEAIAKVLSDFYTDQFAAVYGFNDFANVDEAYRLFAQAIAAYERSPRVMKFNSAFDRDQLEPDAMKGRTVFQKYCSSCHPLGNNSGFGAPFTTFGYINIGLPENPEVDGDEGDLGLGMVVPGGRQDGKFKIPTLRNVARTGPYGHNGYFASLRDMVEFINGRNSLQLEPDIPQNVTSAIGNLNLTPMQIDHLLAFLEALTDE